MLEFSAMERMGVMAAALGTCQVSPPDLVVDPNIFPGYSCPLSFVRKDNGIYLMAYCGMLGHRCEVPGIQLNTGAKKF